MSSESASLRAQEEATNRAKEEALRTYDEALRVQGHPDAGSKVGDKLTEAAYAAGHRLDEVTHRAQDAIGHAISKDSKPTTNTSESK
jgi:hypothetical protein